MPCVDNVRPVPGETSLESNNTDESQVSAVDEELYLPHSLPDNLRSELSRDVLTRYRCLRYAQCEDALATMKRSLRKGATLFDHQSRQTSGTGVAANTRMNAAIGKQNAKAQLDAARYRAAREALLVEDPLGTWKLRLKVLDDKDIRPPPSEKIKKGGKESEGRKTLTWIWKVPRASDAEVLDDVGDNATGIQTEGNELAAANEGT